MRVWTLPVLALVGLGFLGCGGGEEAEQPDATVEVADTDTAVAIEPGDGAATAADADPASGQWCSYVSAADVGTVLGTPVAEPEPTGFAENRGTCTFAATEATGRSASVQFFPTGEYEAAVNAGGRGDEVTGLGEEAWRTDDAGLLVRTSRPFSFAVHVVDVEGGDIQELRDAERALAERVLAGL